MLKDNNFLLTRTSDDEFIAYEKILGHKLRSTLAELYTVNAGVFISYIIMEQDENIEDIISSSTELTLRPGTLRYGRSAAVDFEWGSVPAVTIDLELISHPCSVFFKVVFQGKFVGIDISAMLFSTPPGDRDDNLRRLTSALEAAVLPKTPPH